MRTIFTGGWDKKSPPSFDEAYAAVASFPFDGVTGFAAHQSLGLQPCFDLHESVRADVTCFIDFLHDSPRDFVKHCDELRGHIAGIMLRAMAFAWHLPRRKRLYGRAQSVMGRFMPACRQVVYGGPRRPSIESLSAIELGVSAQWFHSVSRCGYTPLLLERTLYDGAKLDHRIQQARIQYDLAQTRARGASGAANHEHLRVQAFIAGLDLYRAQCERLEFASSGPELVQECNALFDELLASGNGVPARLVYRLMSAKQRLVQSGDCVEGLSQVFHEEMADLMRNANNTADRASAVIAEVNAAVAEEDRASAMNCVDQLRASPALVIEHKSSLSLESAVVAAAAVPWLAEHFWREIELVPFYKERLDQATYIHSLIPSDRITDFALSTSKRTVVVSSGKDDEVLKDGFARNLRHLIYQNCGPESEDRFWNAWSVRDDSKRTRIVPVILRSLMQALPDAVRTDLCRKGSVRGMAAVADRVSNGQPMRVSLAALKTAVTGPEGKARIDHLLSRLTHDPVELDGFAQAAFICTACGAVHPADDSRSARPSRCEGCRRPLRSRRVETPEDVLFCPSRDEFPLAFVNNCAKGQWDNAARINHVCPCGRCKDKKRKLVRPQRFVRSGAGKNLHN